MSARLFAAGRIPPRRPGMTAPIAAAERLAWFVRETLGGDRSTIEDELAAWRDRESLPLDDWLLEQVAKHVSERAA